MNDEWISKLKDIHEKKGWIHGQPVETEDILQAFKDAGMTEEEQAELLAGFMAAVDVKPADVAPAAEPAPAPTILTLAQIIDMVRDPSRMEELKAALAAMPADKKQELMAQVQSLTPSDAPKPEDVATQKLVQPVLNVMQAVQTIVTSSTPKRTKMLDVIEALNKVLPSPALTMKDDKGETYAAKLIALLKSHADKFGTTATPGDKFVQLINSSIQQNKPVELPQAALESELHNLRRAAGIT